MAEQCTHCALTVEGNFCSSCGQKKFKRIDRKYLWDEIQYTLLHTNKGLLYSLKKIARNPGKTAREFIEGDRVSHYKPILLVFLLSGFSTFISFKVTNMQKVMAEHFAAQKMNSPMMNDFLNFTSSYNSLLMLVYIPLFAIATYLCFRKWGQNYYEHVVMNAYILSFYTLLCLVFLYPPLYFLQNDSGAYFTFNQYALLAVPLMLVWFFKGYYHEHSLKEVLLRLLGVLGITFLGYLLIIIVVGVLMFVYAMSLGPEALQYVKPVK